VRTSRLPEDDLNYLIATIASYTGQQGRHVANEGRNEEEITKDEFGISTHTDVPVIDREGFFICIAWMVHASELNFYMTSLGKT
jgi:hypothetical protein